MQLKNKHADDYYESVYETSSTYIYMRWKMKDVTGMYRVRI